jgi:glycosyltransferase involved in cell wall biosynthesis
MRILHVAEALDGGVLSLLRTYTSWQQQHGHDVHVLGSVAHELEVGFTHWELRRSRPASYPAALRQLRRTVDEFAPDVVHLHSFFAGLVGRMPAAVPAGGVVYQPHSWVFAMSPSRLFATVAVALERRALRRTDRLVTNCQDEAQEGRVRGVAASGGSVGLPVDTDRFRPAERSGSLDHDRPVRVICVGRICRQKSQDRLVAAWEHRPVPGAELVLVGPGDHHGLAALAPREWDRSIHAVGAQDNVLEWLQSADLFALTSRYEGQSVAVAEALACGLPVVMFDVNGAREAVVEGPEPPGGVVVAQGDTDELVRQVRRRVEDGRLRRDESAQARHRAVTRGSIDEVMHRLMREYERVVSHEPRTERA